jgi:hypothetical protein
MNRAAFILRQALQLSVVAAALLSSVLFARLLCDTVAWRWQQWYFAPPDQHIAPTSSVVFERDRITNRADLLVFMSMWQGLRDDYSSSKAVTDLRDNVIPVGHFARLARYTDEVVWPFGYIGICTVTAAMTIFLSCWLGVRLAAEQSPLRAVAAPITPRMLMSISLSCAVALPFASIISWYLSFDRTGIEVRHGSTPYALPMWHTVCWPLLLAILTGVVKRSRMSQPVAQPTPVCARCGYPASGLTGVVCPECGQLFATKPARRATHAVLATLGFLTLISIVLIVRGTVRTATWDQVARGDVAGPVASLYDLLYAWTLLAPAAPVSWRATPLGALTGTADGFSNFGPSAFEIVTCGMLGNCRETDIGIAYQSLQGNSATSGPLSSAGAGGADWAVAGGECAEAGVSRLLGQSGFE